MSGAKKRILIIEKDASVRFALRRVSLGPEIETQFSETVEWSATETGYAVVLTDDSILAGTGEKLPLTILQERLKCPVIIMTTSGNKRFDSFAKDSGAFSVLHKPFTAGELRKHLGKAMDDVSQISETNGNIIDSPAAAVTPAQVAMDLGERIAGDQIFDDLFVELERRQPLEPGLDAFDVVERHLVKRALTSCEGNQSHAARFLGITRNTLRKRIHKYGLSTLHSVDESTTFDENL